MIEIGNRYVRTSPIGDKNVVVIKTDEEAQYHTDLAGRGFKYEKVVVHSDPNEMICESCQ